MANSARTPLPVIVGFGGFNAAGRSSFHHGYRRTILASLSAQKQQTTLLSLASLMGLVSHDGQRYIDQVTQKPIEPSEIVAKYQDHIELHTLIRRIDDAHFDVDKVPSVADLNLQQGGETSFVVNRREVPTPLPENWKKEVISDDEVRITVHGDINVKATSYRQLEVQSAGILPRGFDPAGAYNSRFHPRSLQLAVLGASDCLNSVGIPWETMLQHVRPDQIAVYAASALGQTDEYGLGGYLQARLKSSRASSKQMALAMNSMPADFINAYVIGSAGTTGAVAGACATFLYNLRAGVDDIVSGRQRVVICGSAEAQINPEVIEGFVAMSALATDARLAKLDGVDLPDHRRASRPFAENCGFTLGESAQYFVLMDDELALELGADIYGAVPNVFINADGFKKSISSPGAGNYITLAKAVSATQAIVGEEVIKNKSFIQAHGSSTPQNRITESMIFDKVANAFGIDQWPVVAVKAFVGHPLGPASGDQLSSTLGCFADGILPGIKTANESAEDVVDDRLDILFSDEERETQVSFLNSKGFGGNNATASVLSPDKTLEMLAKRHGQTTVSQYLKRLEPVQEYARSYDEAALQGDLRVKYHFGEDITEDHDIGIKQSAMTIAQFPNEIELDLANQFEDMV